MTPKVTLEAAQRVSNGQLRSAGKSAGGRLVVYARGPEPRLAWETNVEGAEGPGPTEVGWKSGIRGDAGTVTVAMEPGATIGVRVRFPPGVDSVSVWATDAAGVRRDAWMSEPSRGTLTGLHPGAWTVKAHAGTPDGALTAEARADAGGSVELDLKPAR